MSKKELVQAIHLARIAPLDLIRADARSVEERLRMHNLGDAQTWNYRAGLRILKHEIKRRECQA